jgi:hypothetical protein
MNDILHRIRWPNVARAAAVLSAVALLISWPHLRGRAPELPPATAAPAEVEPVAPPAAAAAHPAGKGSTAARSTAKAPKARPKAKAVRHRPAARHRARRPPHHHPASRRTAAPASGPASAPSPAYVPPAPSPPPAAEFRP